MKSSGAEFSAPEFFFIPNMALCSAKIVDPIEIRQEYLEKYGRYEYKSQSS